MTQPPDFDALYGADSDPWRVGSSWYEQRKIDVVLSALTRERYERVLDPACGTGQLALALGERAGAVDAFDGSSVAVTLAGELCGSASNVKVGVRRLPYAAVDPAYDLVVVSEVLYYLDEAERIAAIDALAGSCGQPAEFVAVHWRPRPDEAFIDGDGLHDELRVRLPRHDFRHVVCHSDQEFVVDVFTR